jgi:photosystem II stability/assembly factor-like uncharacterized protein
MNTRALLLLAAMAGSPLSAQAADPAGKAAQPAATIDVLDRPAQVSPLASKRLLQKVVRAGDRLVAVGPRGHILVSTDAGQTWKQAAVPVSSDLTSVFFVSDKAGWAVGHDGVILATSDGGDSWVKQLDGRAANELLLKQIKARVAAEPNSKELAALLTEAERYAEQGPDKPFLDVWFENASTGYAVGAYNLLFVTTDGGKSWQPWFDRTDNPKFFNLYAIRPSAGGLYIAGEGGLVLKLDAAAQRFRAVPVDYRGSLFGLVDAGDAVLVYGLRGNAFRSDDGGKHWSKVDSTLAATIVAGTRTAKGTLLLADQGGRIAASTDGGKSFARLQLAKTLPVTSLTEAGADQLAITGPMGVMTVAAPAGR